MKEQNKKITITLLTILLGIVFIIISFKSYIECYSIYDGIITEAVVESTIQQSVRDSSGQKYYVTNYIYQVGDSTYHGNQIVHNKIREGKQLKIYYDKTNPEQNGIMEVNIYSMCGGIIFLMIGIVFFIRELKNNR